MLWTLFLGSWVLAAVDVMEVVYISELCEGTVILEVPVDGGFETCDDFLEYIQSDCLNYGGSSCDSITLPACLSGGWILSKWGPLAVYYDCIATTDSPTAVPTDATCDDEMRNGNEEGVDCGGDCPLQCPSNCENYDCPETHILIGDADTVYCTTYPCDSSDLETCCDEKALCSTMPGCPGTLVLRTDPETISCIDIECDIFDDRDQCCIEPSSCEDFELCDGTTQYLKSAPQTLFCDSEKCDDSDIEKCCESKAQCTSYSCDYGAGLTLKPNSETIYCALSSCTDNDSDVCCTARGSCQQFECVDPYLDKSDKDYLFCSSITCVDSDWAFCCDERHPCMTDLFTYDCSGSVNTLSPDARNLYCTGLTCVSPIDDDICCPAGNMPTSTPTLKPTSTPVANPLPAPSPEPTNMPTLSPTLKPTSTPAANPLPAPSPEPNNMPTLSPTLKPSSTPVANPLPAPSPEPIAGNKPTSTPTVKPTSTPAAPTTQCGAIENWTEDRASELCPGNSNHAYGVELCDTWNNPDYQRRLNFGLANELYTDCSHSCVYDYDTYNTDRPHAFKWIGSCYTLQIDNWSCIEDEESMSHAHEHAATLCEPADSCVERVAWSPDVAERNCPDGDGGKDKGYGTARVCPELVRLDDGFYERADVLYQATFDLSLANHIFWSCSSKCVYDIDNAGVVYQWKGGDCWLMQTKWACIETHANEYSWALEYVSENVCPTEPTPAPVSSPCVERVEQWNENIALEICGYDDMGFTDKSSNAVMCPGEEDYQYRLDHSLANRVFLACDAWCVYDIYKTADEAFVWRNGTQCWKHATSGDCFKFREAMSDYIENVLCESTTPEPTEAPTCTTQEEWSEELMDEYCSVEDSQFTYRHNSSIGRAPVPCEGWEDNEADLLKSLAIRSMWTGCSAWCVYDYNSDAIQAWKWKNNAKCWDLTSSGSCFYKDGEAVADWEDAKEAINVMCTYSPTPAPTACMPYFAWDADRAEEICPNADDADKTYDVEVCTDSNSATKQEELEVSLANHFFTQCSSWCVYDYDTVINNVKTDSTDYGGFVWRNNQFCWKWVTSGTCFGVNIDEYNEVVQRTYDTCEVQS